MESSSRWPGGRDPSVSSPSEAPSRQSSRPPPRSRNSDTMTETSIPRPQFPSTPLKGILKNSSVRPSPDPLAARFYRLPRPIRSNHTSPSVQSPSYFSDSTHGSFDLETDSQSASSELSVNTQATSVDSDSVITKRLRPPKPTKPSNQVRHVRGHAQLSPSTRPKVRPKPRTCSEVTKTSAPSGKRTVHIEVLPRQETPSSQELQLVRRPDQGLVCKIDQLESDRQKLRQAQDQLHRDLDDASEELSSKVRQNKEIGKALTQERHDKELIAQDLREERRLFDIFRQDFELQQRILEESEKERDNLKHDRDHFEQQLIRLEDEMSQREAEQKASEDMLRSQLSKFEMATATLEKRINSRDREVDDLMLECDSLIQSSKKYQAEIESVREEGQEIARKQKAALEAEKKEFNDYMKEAEGEKANLRAQVQGLEVEIDALKAQIADFKPTKQALERELETEKASKAELQGKLQVLESEKNELLKQVDAERDATDAARENFAKQLQTSKDQFSRDLETVKNESENQLMASKEDFERQLKEVKHDFREKLDDANFKLQIEVEAKGDLVYQLNIVKKELGLQADTFKIERSEKQARIDGLVTEVAGSNEANISLASQRLQLSNELNQVRVNLASVQTNFNELQDRYKSLAIDNDYQRSKAAELDHKTEDLNNLRRAYDSLEARVGNLRADIDDHHAANKSLLVENEKLRAAHQNLRDDHERANAHARSLEDSSGYSRLSAEKFALEAQLDEQESKVTALSQEKAGLEARAAVLEAEADKVETLTREKIELEARRGDLQGEADKAAALAAQNQTLSAQLASVSQQLAGVYQQLEGASAAHGAAEAQVRDLQATIGRLQSHGRSLSRSTSRGKSRSKSCAPGTKRVVASPSSSLVFVRSPSDKSGVYITTKEALKSGE